MRRLVCSVIIILMAPLLCISSASAHVLITDRSKATSAVLHISPDDDPIAGQPAALYFDIESKQLRSLNGYIMHVRNASDSQPEQSVPARVNGHSLQIAYTFPTQGQYELSLRRTEVNSGFDLRYSLRVARGTTAGAGNATSSQSGAHAVVAISFVGLAVIAILVVNNRRQMFARSSF